MKDKLGREIERGDTLAYVGIDFCQPQGIYRKLDLCKVVDVASFAIMLEPVGAPDEYFRKVVDNTSEMVVVR